MATILLGALGAQAGGIWGTVGALAGAVLDSALSSALQPVTRQQGPRLTTTDIQTSTEGAGITRLYGRARTAGQIIWATRFEEEISTERTGGKGSQPKVETTTYSYFANVAIGLCEGPIAGIGRIWTDGDELDQTLIEARLYRGTADQMPDPLIEAKEGTAPAYRNLAYLVFERLPLAPYGNRIPQIAVEVYRPTGRTEQLIQGVALIPGNEFGYATTAVKTTDGESENRHTLTATTDLVASIDRLVELCPNLKSVMLVVSWFGDDLRCGICSIRPKVDSVTKRTKGMDWKVAGLERDEAQNVSILDGSPIYGGTPTDDSVVQAIRHLNARGIAITYCPFIMMDIVGGNGRPDPYGGGEQARLPWRGRITCHPAAGRPGTPDKTAAAAAQISSFLGTVTAAHFDVDHDDGRVDYDGPDDDWGFRRFILHNAALAAAAGGIDSFVMGSEMIGVSQIRASATTYPFVAGLKALAGQCRALLGPGVKIGYAADWSEWLNHRPADGSGDVLFHLDPLWADPNIDFVGIDAYVPLADWRDGSGHLDFSPTGPVSIHDQAYLQRNIEGGENFDWFYANTAARLAQNRSPIGDGSPAAEPWIFRNKDIRNWWHNLHHDRPAGVRAAAATAWTPQSKPVRLIELGCPAVDKGANQPNLFPDPRSDESGYPWFSSRARDDGMQRAFLEALLGYWSDPAKNPISAVYGSRMLDLTRSHVWCWDSRPWPSYPIDENWGDAPNWQTGHWLSGRLGAAPAGNTISAILAEAGFAAGTVEPLAYTVDGVTSNGIQSPRTLLEALRPVFGFEAVESDGVIKFRDRFATAALAIVDAEALVAEEDGISAWRRSRGQETELPAAVKLSFGDPVRQDQAATAEARRATSVSRKTVSLSPPVIMAATRAREVAELELAAAWTGREQISAKLPPSLALLDPCDVIRFGPIGRLVRLTEIDDGDSRNAKAVEVDPPAAPGLVSSRPPAPAIIHQTGIDPTIVLVDGPLLRDSDSDHPGYIAGVMAPFRYGIAAWRSPEASGYVQDTLLDLPAIIGVTTTPLYSGPAWRFDRRNQLTVRLMRGSLLSVTEAALLGGANALMVENAEGEWEVLQVCSAELIAPLTYRLSNLLRGQKGSEHAMRDPVAAGARLLFLDAALRQTGLTTAELGVALNWRAGPADRDISGAEPPVTIAMRGKARRPLAPVHLRARTVAGGDIALSWIRRSRMSADSWDQADVPLGETVEAYELDIYAGATRVRTVATATPSFTYTAATRTADGVALPFTFSVSQMSQSFGRGIPAWSTAYG